MSDTNTSGTVQGSRITFEGGRNVTYDLKGTDSRFANTNHPLDVVVFEPQQIITFPVPVYKNANLIVKKLVQNVGGNDSWETVLEGDNGWLSLGIDPDATSKAFVLWNDPESEFEGELIKEIQVNLVQEEGEKVYLKIYFQKFFMDLYDYNGFDGVGPNYTPALGKWLLDKIDALDATVAANIKNTFASTDSIADMKEEDLTGTLPDNFIQYEEHTAATSKGVDTIMPARGSFYSNELTIYKYIPRSGSVQLANYDYNVGTLFKYTDTAHVGSSDTTVSTTKRVLLTPDNYNQYIGMTGIFIDINKPDLMTKMELDRDYVIENLNVVKTQKSSSEYGVYDSIRLLVAYNGALAITYHAFGGQVVFGDVKDMRQDVLNTMRILSDQSVVTTKGLERQPVIKDLLTRMRVVEQYHNHFNQVEHSVHTGSKGFHWFNIAQLYDVNWGEEMSSVDEIGTFRIESALRGWCYEFVLSVDLTQKLFNMLRCKTLGTNASTIVDLKGYKSYFGNRDDVAIRLCWGGTSSSDDNGKTSGVMLQLGWSFDNYAEPTNGVDTDTIIVTNKSGITSKWKLVYNPLDTTYTSEASKKLYNHVTYEAVDPDSEFQTGVKYYKFNPVYMYFKTASAYIKSNTLYFNQTIDETTGVSTYTDVTSQVTPGRPVSDYKDIFKNGLFERELYNRVAYMLSKEETPVGTKVGPGVYVIADTSYASDTKTLLPNEKITWVDGGIYSHQLYRILEPNDGLLAWVGTLDLATINGQEQVLTSVLKEATVKVLDPMSIKGITFRLYDRKSTTDKEMIISRTAEVCYKNSTDDAANGQVIIDLMDLCGCEVSIYRESGKLKFKILPYLGTDSYINNRYDLRQIELHF